METGNLVVNEGYSVYGIWKLSYYSSYLSCLPHFHKGPLMIAGVGGNEKVQ